MLATTASDRLLGGDPPGSDGFNVDLHFDAPWLVIVAIVVLLLAGHVRTGDGGKPKKRITITHRRVSELEQRLAATEGPLRDAEQAQKAVTDLEQRLAETEARLRDVEAERDDALERLDE